MSAVISFKTRVVAFINRDITVSTLVFVVGIVCYTMFVSSVAIHLKADDSCGDVHYSLYTMHEWFIRSNANNMIYFNETMSDQFRVLNDILKLNQQYTSKYDKIITLTNDYCAFMSLVSILILFTLIVK